MNHRPWTAVAVVTAIFAVARAAEIQIEHPGFDLWSGTALLQLLGAAATAAVVLTGIARGARVRGRARIHAIFWLGALVALTSTIEAVVFQIAPIATLGALFVIACGAQALVATYLDHAVVPRGVANAPSPRPIAWWVVRLVLLGVVYCVIYFVAGGIIYAFVRDFYADKTLPSFGALVALQGGIRGPMFALAGAGVVSVLRTSRAVSAAATGAALAGVGGVFALLAPNPLFPDGVRFVHLAEVAISNLVFGAIVGWAMWRR